MQRQQIHISKKIMEDLNTSDLKEILGRPEKSKVLIKNGTLFDNELIEDLNFDTSKYKDEEIDVSKYRSIGICMYMNNLFDTIEGSGGSDKTLLYVCHGNHQPVYSKNDSRVFSANQGDFTLFKKHNTKSDIYFTSCEKYYNPILQNNNQPLIDVDNPILQNNNQPLIDVDNSNKLLIMRHSLRLDLFIHEELTFALKRTESLVDPEKTRVEEQNKRFETLFKTLKLKYHTTNVEENVKQFLNLFKFYKDKPYDTPLFNMRYLLNTKNIINIKTLKIMRGNTFRDTMNEIIKNGQYYENEIRNYLADDNIKSMTDNNIITKINQQLDNNLDILAEIKIAITASQINKIMRSKQNIRINNIVTSPMRRCLETSDILRRYLDIYS